MKIQDVIKVVGLVVLGSTAYVQAAGGPILLANTAKSTAGERVVPPAVLSEVVRTLKQNEKQDLDGCLSTLNLPQGNYQPLFKAVLLPSRGEQVYFVRPSLNPYCQAFYGIQGFRHWLVAGAGSAFQLRYVGVGDTFKVLNTVSNANYDIAETHCTVSDCQTVSMKYDGARYTPFSCSEVRSSAGSGNDAESVIPCRGR